TGPTPRGPTGPDWVGTGLWTQRVELGGQVSTGCALRRPPHVHGRSEDHPWHGTIGRESRWRRGGGGSHHVGVSRHRRRKDDLMTAPLFIVGAGGFGREVFSIIEALATSDTVPNCTGFIDDAPSAGDMARVDALGRRVVGSVNDLIARTEPFCAVLAIGSASARRAIADLLSRSPVTFPVLVHPNATLGCEVRLAEGVVVAA